MNALLYIFIATVYAGGVLALALTVLGLVAGMVGAVLYIIAFIAFFVGSLRVRSLQIMRYSIYGAGSGMASILMAALWIVISEIAAGSGLGIAIERAKDGWQPLVAFGFISVINIITMRFFQQKVCAESKGARLDV